MHMVTSRLPTYSPTHSWTVSHENHYVLLAYTHTSRNYAGVFIDYYGGEAESHIVQYAARLYFFCKAGTSLEGPVLEHLKDSYTAHIHFYTEHVC